MTSKFPFAGHLLMSLLLAAECNSAAADERGLHLIAMAKAASGGAAWDRLEILIVGESLQSFKLQIPPLQLPLVVLFGVALARIPITRRRRRFRWRIDQSL